MRIPQFFLCFISVSLGFSVLKSRNSTACYQLRLRDIPVSLQNAEKSHESYISAKVHDRLVLIFNKACDPHITCIIQNIWKNTTKTLTTDRKNIDYYLEENSHGHVRCANSHGEFLSFYILVERDDGKFFTDMTLINDQSGFLVQCLGGYYSKDVKLKINGKYLEAQYNPIKGFNISKEHSNHSKIYQCEKVGDNRELKSLIYHPSNQPVHSFQDRFLMEQETFMFQTVLKCIIEDDNSMPWEQYDVILSCSNQYICPVLKQNIHRGNQRIFSATLNKTLITLNSDFSCVFLKNDEVIAQAFLKENNNYSMVLTLGIIFVVLAVIITFCLKSTNSFEYKKIKQKPRQLKKFGSKDLLLHSSEPIGKGNSSYIHVIQLKENGRKVVVKYSEKPSQFLWELKMLTSLKHSNIVTALGTAVLPAEKSCYKLHVQRLVLPYYPKTSLDKYINKFYPPKPCGDGADQFFFSENSLIEKMYSFEMISILWQIGNALKYLKEKEITHRDVALRNCLISDDNICKLTDFERAQKGETLKISVIDKWKKKLQKDKKIPITIWPIEAIEGYYYYSSEVFSFGNLMLELYQFGETFKHSNENYILQLRQPPKKPQFCPPRIYDLIKDCMSYDHRKRPCIQECEARLALFAEYFSRDRYLATKRKLQQQQQTMEKVSNIVKSEKICGYDKSPARDNIDSLFNKPVEALF
uniref:Protein kinase domain-containing protein n=1 Tax=Caenorhabditis japonica TaxID=281687 RepID=A0A8R1HWZ7_CAEJA